MTDSDAEQNVATGFSVTLESPPVNPGYFYNASRKVARAEAHIIMVESLISSYIDSVPISLGCVTSEPPKYHLQVEKYERPPEVGLVVGDAIHNLRAALDVMAGDLAEIAGKSSKGVYFPFANSEDDLDLQIKCKKFRRAGKDCEALLKTFRPFKGGNAALRALHDLDVVDKHSNITPVIAVAATGAIDFEGIAAGRFKTGVTPSSILFSFHAAGPLGGQEIVPSLHDLAETVKGILEAFAALVANRS